MKYRYLIVSLLLTTLNSHAEVINTRNFAMGGTGVASSGLDAASQSNPALLANPHAKQKIGLIFPSVGVEVSDEGEVIDALDDSEDLFDEFEALVDSVAFDNARATELKDDIVEVLTKVDEEPVAINGAALVSLSVPLTSYSFALDQRYRVQSGVLIDYNSGDDVIIQQAIDSGDSNELDNMTSSVDATAAMITETVLSFAKGFSYGDHSFSVGISPKFVKVDTYFYSERANDSDSDDFEADEFKKGYSDVNIDIGLAYYINPKVTAGLVIRDLISKKYETVTVDNKKDNVQINLSSSAGIAYRNSFFTGAFDIDLIPQKGIESIEESQFARVGMELNAADWAQLCFGYRSDLNNYRKDAISAGINLSPFNTVHLGLSGMVAGDNSAGAALSLKITI